MTREGDLINRQAMIDAMYELCNTGETLKENPWRDNPHIDDITDAINDLPSVNPQEPKTESVTEFADRCRECGKMRKGHWIAIDEEPHEVWECDHCGFVIDGSGCIEPYEYRDIYKYCPNCGAKMFEPQESEEV